MIIKDLIDLIQTFAIIVSGLWIVYTIKKKREFHPKIEFNLNAKFIGEVQSQNIFEFIAILQNKGLVRHYIDVDSFILKIRYLTSNDEIKNKAALPSQKNESLEEFFLLNFPHSIKPDFGKDKILFMPSKYKYIWVDPDVTQTISLPLSIPNEAKYILLKSEFKYKDSKSEDHTAQIVFNVDELKKRGDFAAIKSNRTSE